MLILFIPGFAGFTHGGKVPTPATSTEPSASTEPVQRPPDPFYTEREQRLIYQAALGLTDQLMEDRGVDEDDNPLWLVEAVNGRALHFGRKHRHSSELVIEALRLIEANVRENPLRAKDKLPPSWRIHDAEFVERSLPLVFTLAAAGVERKRSTRQPGAVGEGDMPEHEEIEFAAGQLALVRDGYVHLKSGPSSYDIELTRIPTAESLLGWIDHLGEKTWVTSQHLHQFVRSVAGFRGWRLHPLPA